GGADDRVLARLTGQERQVLADLDAGDIGGDGLEVAADLGRRFRFQVEGPQLRWATAHEQQDARLGFASRRTGRCRGSSLSKQLRQGQTGSAQAADAEKIAPRDTVAEAMFVAWNSQHDRIL